MIGLLALAGCGPAVEVPGTYVEAPGFGRVLVERPTDGPPTMIAVAIGASPADLPDDVVVVAVDHTAWIRRGAGQTCWAPAGELAELVRQTRAALDLPALPVLLASRGEGTQLALAILQADPLAADRAALSGLCPAVPPAWPLCAPATVPWEAVVGRPTVAVARPCAAVRPALDALGIAADADLPAAVARARR